MARSRSLPPRMYLKHGAYYHVAIHAPFKWTRLGSDLSQALKMWADLEGKPLPFDNSTFNAVADIYVREVLPKLRDRTQQDYLKHLVKLRAVFHFVQLTDIEPFHVSEYLRVRGKASTHQANREKAVLSLLFNFARSSGLVKCSNPCEGIKGHSEKARARYVTDDEFTKVRDASPWFVQDAMDLALLMGQRPSDTFKIQLQDVQVDYVSIRQLKTTTKMRISRIGAFALVLDRVLLRDRLTQHPESQLLVAEGGKPLTQFIFRKAFDQARLKAGVTFQFRDLRAKAATDTNDLDRSQKLMGHSSRNTTEIYIRDRLGALVQPLR